MSIEGQDFNNIPEGENNPEVGQFLEQLDAEAARIGVVLEQTDFVKIGADEAMRLEGQIEIILSALAIAAGLAIGYEASQSLFQSHPGADNLEVIRLAQNLGVAALGAGGAALMFKGFSKLEAGYKKLLGYVRLKELKD